MSPLAVPASWMPAAPAAPSWPPSAVPTLPTRRLFAYEPLEGILTMEVDNTSLEHFATCARSAQYRLVESREGTSNMAAKHYGSAKHLYLEARLKGAGIPEAEQVMVNFLTENSVEDPQNWRTASHAIESMRGYENWWNAMPIQPVIHNGEPLVEIGFKLPLCEVSLNGSPLSRERLLPLLSNPEDFPEGTLIPTFVRVYWTGRIDTVAPFLGENYVWDHKTTSQVGPTYYDHFQLAAQTHGYLWATWHKYPELNVRGLRINTIVGRAPSRTGIAHAYERQTYVLSEEHVAEWKADTEHLVSDFISHLLRDYFPKQTSWCQGKFGTCQYFPVCSSAPVSRPIVLASNLYQDCTWSPLNNR